MSQYSAKIKIPMNKTLVLPTLSDILEWHSRFKRTYEKTKSKTFKENCRKCCKLIELGIEHNAIGLDILSVKTNLFFTFIFSTPEDLFNFCTKYLSTIT